MKAPEVMLPLAFAWLAAAVRLETDCPPKEKCFTGTNECHAVYSSCWDECLLGSVVPTVTPPACTDDLAAIVVTEQAQITGTGVEPCRPGVVCIDGLAFCGNVTAKWGGCYETCSGIQPTAPSCAIKTLPPLMTGTAPIPTTRTRKVRTRSSRSPCAHSQAWRCAPPGW